MKNMSFRRLIAERQDDQEPWRTRNPKLHEGQVVRLSTGKMAVVRNIEIVDSGSPDHTFRYQIYDLEEQNNA